MDDETKQAFEGLETRLRERDAVRNREVADLLVALQKTYDETKTELQATRKLLEQGGEFLREGLERAGGDVRRLHTSVQEAIVARDVTLQPPPSPATSSEPSGPTTTATSPYERCPECKGFGAIDGKACERCKKTGLVLKA